MTSQEACLGMNCSGYTFSSGSNGWLGMVLRSIPGTRSIARSNCARIPFLSSKRLTCEAMRAARLARLSGGGGGEGGYAGDAR